MSLVCIWVYKVGDAPSLRFQNADDAVELLTREYLVSGTTTQTTSARKRVDCQQITVE